MKPKSLKQLRELNKTLSGRKLEIYLTTLRVLCSTHSEAPGSREALILIRNKDLVGLVNLGDSLSQQKYCDARQHFLANQLSLLLRKYPHPDKLGLKPKQNAEKKFWQAERKCGRQNLRFKLFDSLRSPNEKDLSAMRHFVQYLLGPVPDVTRIVENGGFGPGASVGVHGNATNFARKLLSDTWSVTPSAYSYGFYAFSLHAQILPLLLGGKGDFVSYDEIIARCNYETKIDMVHNNKIAFVPKTAKVHRTIAVEPLINGYLQKGVDHFMRLRLKRVGIDLSDQSINQRMARIGSLSDDGNSFVTIDLSSASDSISIGLVRNLLPPDWFAFLNAIRSKAGDVEGEIFTYNKFCSMGNGFCFPLESLLFTAACLATNCGLPSVDFSVFGDDIIVRKRYATKLISLLRVMGFSVNKEKTFLEGPFRESCGADWFGGEDVRPYTLDHELDSLSSLFKFLNLTQRNNRCQAYFACVRDYILSLIPRHFRFFRPVIGNADSGITVELDLFMSSPFARWNKHLACWGWNEMVTIPVSDRIPERHSEYRKALVYGALTGSSSAKPFTLRRETKSKIRHVSYSAATSQWLPSWEQPQLMRFSGTDVVAAMQA